MIYRSLSSLEFDIVREPGAKQTTLKRLIDTPDGADRFVMTLFHLATEGSSPPHYHEWEHEIFVVKGSFTIELPSENKEIHLKEGDVAFIPRNEAHAFKTNENEECDILVVAPVERPPINNVFLSEENYQYDVNRENL